MFSKNLRRLREQHKKTQKELAEYLGITRQGYGHYESGERKADQETTSKLADYFGVSVDYLLGRDDLASRLSNVADQAKRGSAVKEHSATEDGDIVVSENDSIYTVVARAKNFPPNKIKKLEKLLDALFDEED